MPVTDQTPQVVIVDNETNLNPLAITSGSATVSGSTSGFVVFGVTTAGTASYFKLDPSGNLFITGSDTSTQGPSGSNPWKVEFYSGSTQVGTTTTPIWVTGSTRVFGSLTPLTASTTTLTNVSSSTSNVTLVAANTARLGLIIYNDSNQTLTIKYGVTASATSMTLKLQADGYWEMPEPIYTGIISGLWSTANGFARITEST